MLPCLLTDTITSDIDRAIHYTLLWGLEGVELRTVGKPQDRVPYVNESKLKRRLAEAELPVAAVVPGMFEGSVENRVEWLNEIAAFEETVQFCSRIGCSTVVVSAFDPGSRDSFESMVEALRKAGTYASRRNIRLAVQNEADMAITTGSLLASLLERVDLANVGAAWNPAVAHQNGEPASEGLEKLGRRVLLVRCFDVVSSAGGWELAPFGEGQVDWPRQIRMLHELGYDGPLSLEVLRDPRPKSGIQDASTLIQLLRKVG